MLSLDIERNTYNLLIGRMLCEDIDLGLLPMDYSEATTQHCFSVLDARYYECLLDASGCLDSNI